MAKQQSMTFTPFFGSVGVVFMSHKVNFLRSAISLAVSSVYVYLDIFADQISCRSNVTRNMRSLAVIMFTKTDQRCNFSSQCQYLIKEKGYEN